MINIKMQPNAEQGLSPKIAVIGVGGAGGNAVNNMISSNLEGCEFIVGNTDAQALGNSLSEERVQLGANVTGGLGAGSRPEIGQAAAEESLDEILRYIEGANMAFITAGMGGGTGTGAAPVIAKACREQGILTVGVVTKPFHFEGAHRMEQAEKGISEMHQYVDTLIVIPNQNLFRIADEKTTFSEAFKMADSVLQSGVRGVTDLMVRPGLVNLDFADIRTAMLQMGKAMMGTGEASGDKRAVEAAEAAINNPLLDDVSMKGAQGVIINVTGGYDMTLFEADEACNRIRDEVDPNANIIFGATFDDSLEGFMRVSIVATGIEKEAKKNTIFGGGNGGGKPMKPANTSETSPVMARANPTTQAEGGISGREAAKAPITGRDAIKTLTAPRPVTEAPVSAPVNQETKVLDAAASVDMFSQDESSKTVPSVEEGGGEETALRGTTYNNSFIPPKPMESDVAVPQSGIGTHISSFHGTHVKAQEGAREEKTPGLKLNPPKPSMAADKRSPSLFERITGSVQQHIDSFRDDGDLVQEPAPQMRASGPTGLSAAPAQPAQASLNISAPAGKPKSQIDEELDIPAFLRRQAN